MRPAGSSMEFWTFWAAMLGIFSFLRSVLPKEYGMMFDTWMRRFLNRFTPYSVFDIPEFYGAGGNEIYDYVQSYLSSNTAIAAQHVNLCRPKNATKNTFSLAHHETVEDTFMETKVWWTHSVSARQQTGINWSSTPNDEKRKYTLKIRKKDKNQILEPYVQHVMEVAKNEKEQSRDRLLYTNVKNGGYGYKKKAWESVPFKHPSTFDTLAMDPVLKDDIKEDLLEFTHGKEFYQKAGKPWKRGYLLYGPPGTGKSSMIAAIANFLNYDIYDVELTEVGSNSELRKLLIQTTNRSVIVIEDIDCSVDLAERAKARKDAVKDGPEGPNRGKPEQDEASRVTLSGLLNFTDGLWSCCGSERIIIFTTNHIEKLDKALLRAGRMDRHINMSWCEYPAFRTLAKNNLGLEWHDLFPKIESAIFGKAIAPADVSEVLLKKKRNPMDALEGLLEALRVAPSVSEKPVVKIDFDENLLTGTIVPDPPAEEDLATSPADSMAQSNNPVVVKKTISGLSDKSAKSKSTKKKSAPSLGDSEVKSNEPVVKEAINGFSDVSAEESAERESANDFAKVQSDQPIVKEVINGFSDESAEESAESESAPDYAKAQSDESVVKEAINGFSDEFSKTESAPTSDNTKVQSEQLLVKEAANGFV